MHAWACHIPTYHHLCGCASLQWKTLMMLEKKKKKLTNDPSACEGRVKNIIHWKVYYCMCDACMI